MRAILHGARRTLPGLRFCGKALGLSLVFGLAGGVGTVLHADLPASRRLVARALSAELSRFFKGNVHFAAVSSLNQDGIHARDIRVTDPYNDTVLVLSDLRVKVDWFRLAQKVLGDDSRITLVIRHVRTERAQVTIIPDPRTGIPTIEQAFTPQPTPEDPSSDSGAPPRYVRVWFPQIEIGNIYGRGRVADLPTLETTLTNARGTVLITPKGAAIDVKRYGMVVRGLGGVDATGTGEVHVRAPGAVWTSFDGQFGDLSTNAFVHVRGDRISARLDLPEAKPDQMRSLWADYPLKKSVSIHGEASGKLPVLDTSFRILAGKSRVAASGPLRVSGDVGINLDVEGRAVDLRAIWPELPETKINADASVALWNKGKEIIVDVNGTTAPATVGKLAVPAADVTGTYNKKGFVGKATLHEKGMPVKLAFTVHPNGVVDLDARAPSFSLEKAPRVEALTRARGRVDVRVLARIDKGKVQATYQGDARGLRVRDVRVGGATVKGSANGELAFPEKMKVSARVSGNNLDAKGLRFKKISASAKGSVLKPQFSASLRDDRGPSIEAAGRLDVKEKPRVEDLALAISRGGATVSGKVRRLDLDGREILVEDLSLKGAGGKLAGQVLVREDRIRVKAKGDNLDLAKIGKALGLPRGSLAGKARIDANISATRARASGKLHLALGDATIASLGGISLRINADLRDRQFQGDASALISGIGAFGGQWETQLNGSALKEQSWSEMLGRAQLQMSGVDLSLLRQILPQSLGIKKVRGEAFGQMRFERQNPKQLPSMFFVAGTKNLKVKQRGEAPDAKAIELTGIDIQLGGGIDGTTGESSGTTRLIDKTGVLASVSGSTRLDLDGFVANPAQALSELTKTRGQALVVLPRRRFEDLPAPWTIADWQGLVSGRATLSGTIEDPQIGALVQIEALKLRSTRRAEPLAIRATGHYQPKAGGFVGNAEATIEGGQRVAWLRARGKAPLDGDKPWSGGAQLAFENTPLGVIPGLADNQVLGTVNGTLAIERPKGRALPLGTANLRIKNAMIDRVPIGNGEFFARSDGTILSATARMNHRTGYLNAAAGASVRWQGLLPSLDPTRRVQLKVLAKDFDAVVLSPFLKSIFSRLSGKVNANLMANLRAKNPKNPDSEWTGQLVGGASVKEGTLQIAPLGLTLRDISLSAQARDAGPLTALEIRGAQGKARSETHNVKASATLYLDGLRLTRAAAAVRATDLPVLVSGVSQAEASGAATFDIQRKPHQMLVNVQIDQLTARLPTASGRNVIDIADNPNIKVIQPLREPSVSTDGRILPWRFVVNLGKNVRLTRKDLNIPLVGQPILDLGEKTTIRGYVDLEPGGRMQTFGKAFVIESGRVLFDTEDPTNPHISATASWRVPDGTTIYVNIRGLLRSATLRVSSDPPRPEHEVMALLIGGSTSGSGERGGAGTTTGVGLMASAFNAMFADTPLSGVEFRTATYETSTYENKASYTAAVQISENVWFEGTYRNNLDSTETAAGDERTDLSGAIDWRFLRNWSLRTEVGTVGAGLDLLWQHRY